MGFCSFRQAKGFVGAGYGQCDDAILGELVNTIRSEMYSWYAEIRLFLDAIECFKLQRFCLNCNQCQDTYVGVTLPRDFQTVEALWINNFPVRLQSEWREFQTMISPECDCRIEKFDVPGVFSTMADIIRPVQLLVSASHPDDYGKRLVIRGIDGAMAPIMHEVMLSRDPQLTPTFRSIESRGGVAKDVTKGRVFITDAGGRLYGRYEPDETMPAYRRIKISGVDPACDVINVRAARRYFPMYGDDDVVETDNAPAFDAMARYLRLYRRADKDQMSMAAEKDHLAKAKSLILGQKSRDAGTATGAQMNIATPIFRGKQLMRPNRRYY